MGSYIIGGAIVGALAGAAVESIRQTATAAGRTPIVVGDGSIIVTGDGGPLLDTPTGRSGAFELKRDGTLVSKAASRVGLTRVALISCTGSTCGPPGSVPVGATVPLTLELTGGIEIVISPGARIRVEVRNGPSFQTWQKGADGSLTLKTVTKVEKIQALEAHSIPRAPGDTQWISVSWS